MEDAWKEGRRRKEENNGSLERKREEEDSLTESGESCGAECDKEREGDAKKDLKVWRGGEKELGE